MADGRMLKKAITTSKKLANLKTDAARLLYTWLLPHLDIEGRFYGNTDVVKGMIVPRIKTITSKIIDDCLYDMQTNGLIFWYEAEGDQYIQFTLFKKHQTLNPDREKKSQIPPPPVSDCNSSTPENSRELQSCHTQDKIKQVKLKEDKLKQIKGKSKKELPSEISTPPKDNSALIEEIVNKAKAMKATGIFPEALKEITKSFDKRLNLNAILHTLNQIQENKPDSAGGYYWHILKKESGNYNEREHTAKQEKFKEDGKRGGKPESIANILKGMTSGT